jgi:hypothetical protein
MGQKNPATRERVALLLAAGRSRSEVCRKTAVSAATLKIWLKEPTFLARVEEFRDTLFSRAIGRLVAGADRASRKMVRLVGSENEQVALNAARTVLASMLKLREFGELAGELKAIRQLLEDRSGGRPVGREPPNRNGHPSVEDN